MNKNDFENLKNFLNRNDAFCRENTIRLTHISEGFAEGEMPVDARHKNGLGFVQGGALFTLADLTFAGALQSFGSQGVGSAASVSFLRPEKTDKLTAKALLIHKGKRTAVFDVDIFNSSGKLLLHATMTGFLSDRPIQELFNPPAPSARNPE